MASGIVVNTLKPSRTYEGRFTLYVFLACVIGSSGGLIFGYDIGISGGVTTMNDFLMKFFPSVYQHKLTELESNYCKYDDHLLQLFSSSLYLAGLFTGFASSWLATKYGRKRSMLFGGISFFIGAVLNLAAQNLIMLIIGRVLLGVGVGCSTQVVPMYLSEMAPAKYRGAFNILFQFSTTFGILVANLINYGTSKMSNNGWRVSLGLAIVPAIMLIFGGLPFNPFCPESPNSLIERNEKQKGRDVLQKIRGSESNVDAEYEDIVEAADLANEVKNPFYTLLTQRKYGPQLVLSILIPFFQQLTGINVIMFYAPVLFSSIGFGDDAALYSAVIVGVVNILSTLVSIALVDKVGRRALFLQGGIQMFICQIIIGSILKMKFGGTSVLSDTYGKVVLSMICIFVAGFAWSWGPLGWLVPSEILPMEVRSAGLAIVVFVNLLLTFAIAQIFLTLLCDLQYGSFFFFGGWEVVATLFVYFFLPETKNIPIEEISRIWNDHWFWRHMVGTLDSSIV